VDPCALIDMGGSNVRVELRNSLQSNDKPLGGTQLKMSKPADDADKQELDRCFNTDIHALGEAIGSLMEDKFPSAIGLAVAGKVAPDRTTLHGAGNVRHWVGQPFVEILSEWFGCPVVLGNDAEAAGLAEALYGHGQGVDEFLSLIWGTGVGGCFIFDNAEGSPYAKPGEPGHVPTGISTPRLCGCGRYDCVESHCGGDGILKKYGRPAEELTHDEWLEVAEKMLKGVYATMLVPVPWIFCSGGVACKQPWLLEHLETRLQDELKIVEPPKLKVSAFGESAGLLGVLALLKRHL
jgi:predicted NBD/HSP70 family sugar kinase